MLFIHRKILNLKSKVSIAYYRLVFRKRFIPGTGFYVRRGFVLHLEESGIVKIGEYVFMNNYCSLNAIEMISIGDNCIFGENVKIYDHNHKYNNKDEPINNQGFSVNPVIIGKNCWIGSNVTILKGVSIGDNVIIGANCLIYKDVPIDKIVTCSNGFLIKDRVYD